METVLPEPPAQLITLTNAKHVLTDFTYQAISVSSICVLAEMELQRTERRARITKIRNALRVIPDITGSMGPAK